MTDAPPPAPTAAEELQDVVRTLVSMADDALRQRDVQRELVETWSSIACENTIQIGIRDARIEELRDAVLRALKLALDRVLDIKEYELLHAIATGIE